MTELNNFAPYDAISVFLSFNYPLTLALICHFVGDFHLQSQRLADQKRTQWKALVIHVFLVGLPLLMTYLILGLKPELGLYFLKIWLLHTAIDYTKYFFNKKGYIKKTWEKYVFLGDQLLHLLAIYYLYDQGLVGVIQLDSHFYPILNVILFLTLISKPVNIIFKLFFSKYQPDEGGIATKAGAGALIGQLERLVMGIFLIWGQYAAIGLVFTAKSIARFDRISKDQIFAEYYLIGSLFSIISVLVLYALLIL